MSLGWISVLEQRTAQALLPAYVEIEEAVRNSPVVHADETLWRERRKLAWLWTASTPGLSLYRIDPRRNQEAFERLLGEDFKHLLVSDRSVGAASVISTPSSARERENEPNQQKAEYGGDHVGK